MKEHTDDRGFDGVSEFRLLVRFLLALHGRGWNAVRIVFLHRLRLR